MRNSPNLRSQPKTMAYCEVPLPGKAEPGNSEAGDQGGEEYWKYSLPACCLPHPHPILLVASMFRHSLDENMHRLAPASSC